MKLSCIHSQNFKGYDARPIKNLYMQKSTIKNQDKVYKELYDIGQDVGFSVHMNYIGGKLAHNPSELIGGYLTRNHNPWAQDNKLFLNNGKETFILYPKTSNDCKNLEASDLAKKINAEAKLSPIKVEGGNIFLGTKDNGEPYAIVGISTLADHMLNSDLGVNEVALCIKAYLNNEHYKKGEMQKIDNLVKDLAKQLGVKEKNMYVLKQPSFHLDLAIRPLKYPYILVNDYDEIDKNVGNTILSQEFLDDYQAHRADDAFFGYANSDETVNELENYGFKPIRIAGVYSDSVNFMNAIVHEKDDGSLCYITNSSKCSKSSYNKIQDIFERDLREKTGIKDIRFVGGGLIKDGNNNVMDYLKQLSGGVHCLASEEPEF